MIRFQSPNPDVSRVGCAKVTFTSPLKFPPNWVTRHVFSTLSLPRSTGQVGIPPTREPPLPALPLPFLRKTRNFQSQRARQEMQEINFQCAPPSTSRVRHFISVPSCYFLSGKSNFFIRQSTRNARGSESRSVGSLFPAPPPVWGTRRRPEPRRDRSAGRGGGRKLRLDFNFRQSNHQ